MAAPAAIFYLLADPTPERPIAAFERRLRTLAGRIPGVDRIVTPHWSPARRLGFGAGLRASVQSLRRHHRSLPPVFVLRPSGEGLPLADVDEVMPFDASAYDSIPRTSTYSGREVYYKLEVFNPHGFERVVYLDCDTVVLDDISPLWDMTRYSEHGLYAVRETAEMGAHPHRQGKHNLGVMLVNTPLISTCVHRELVAIARRGESSDFSDQGVVERYLAQRPEVTVGELEPGYNVMVPARTHGRWDLFEDRVKILHYTNHLKPWSPFHRHDLFFDPEFKRLWDDAYRSDLEGAQVAPRLRLSRDEEFFTRLVGHTENFGHVRWLGRPVWQNILDLWTIQETIFEVRPSLLIECGTFHGGSAYFFATLFDLMGHGRVITVDVDPAPELTHSRITCVTGESTTAETVAQVACAAAQVSGPIMVLLDSDHREAHVRNELEAYQGFVTPGSFIMVQDGVIDTLPLFAGARPGPLPAIEAFLEAHPEFEVDTERCGRFLITHSPKGWLRRR